MASFASSATTCGARKHAWTKRKKERLNDGNNNGQATHGARKTPWPTSYGTAPQDIRTRGQKGWPC